MSKQTWTAVSKRSFLNVRKQKIGQGSSSVCLDFFLKSEPAGLSKIFIFNIDFFQRFCCLYDPLISSLVVRVLEDECMQDKV